MTTTVQQVLDLARVPLNDAAKKRYTDAVLLGYYNSAVQRVFSLRPDLFIGTAWAAPTATVIANVATDVVPVPDRYLQFMADYIGGRAEMKDDEAADNGRAAALMALFERGMVS